ncbi:MAG: hypothetical protein COV08_01540 [Candidatus Vogelbacteria bacterium CG10_big_fil_rev_8_21_14_0_10_49_38]|uniref:Carbohydrate kinase PfkB domain-containing protein n=1 Tax=Candidatus Vogelbacteria bacterium CG10_big_fil_rev_8_21_14_0_10_49_38 TaxID=1975043 RepID=A0A2H0RHP9_9BACT|nr:MAG: hypothetical protein BK006_01555 [bacterium CG10_49_38]PIR46082.1 MAG: hypothetical protein COV08_01540 [Candidatus Vogelbacteria bacterium CG10_big_fil_rev_8_21_14_0_10_49_38]
MAKFDLVAVGDNATDAFIKIKEAELHCDINKSDCQICLDFAAKIPYESVTEVPAGGNSANVIQAVAKLGLSTAYVSTIGDDVYGQKTLATLIEAGVNTDLLLKQSGRPTNYNYVLWYLNDRTILVKHEENNYVWPSEITPPDWLYLSSVNDSDSLLHREISSWLNNHPETKLIFSPGTTQIEFGREKLKEIYARTDVFFANRSEYQIILKTEEPDLKKLVLMMRDLGPKIIIITDAENGATGLDEVGQTWHISAWETKTLERTGAGDAFAAASSAALALNLGLPTALAWGAINAASVVTQVGPHAGQLTRAEIESRLSANPTFRASEI